MFHFTADAVPQSRNKKLNLSFVSLICLETTIDMSNGKLGENSEKDWTEIRWYNSLWAIISKLQNILSKIKGGCKLCIIINNNNYYYHYCFIFTLPPKCILNSVVCMNPRLKCDWYFWFALYCSPGMMQMPWHWNLRNSQVMIIIIHFNFWWIMISAEGKANR